MGALIIYKEKPKLYKIMYEHDHNVLFAFRKENIPINLDTYLNTYLVKNILVYSLSDKDTL